MGSTERASAHAPRCPTAVEFFAGIGLARAGLEAAGIATTWAVDYDASKQRMYEGQWGAGGYVLADVRDVRGRDVPAASVAWASSPCTDLSLAGNRTGLRHGRESAAFFEFTRVLAEMGPARPPVVVLENVVGLATSHRGKDLSAAVRAFNDLGYSVDAISLDARRFVPQSRPRIFVVGVRNPLPAWARAKSGTAEIDAVLRPGPLGQLHADPALRTHITPLPHPGELLEEGFTALVEQLPESDPRWWSQRRVAEFAASMSATQRARLDAFIAAPGTTARTAYRRTRGGAAIWEMRADDISGCLRTPRGGSSRQAVAVMGGGRLRVRWMTGLEYARLMGAGEYNLAGLRDRQVHYGFGDAVAAPAVAWVAEHLIKPALAGRHAHPTQPSHHAHPAQPRHHAHST